MSSVVLPLRAIVSDGLAGGGEIRSIDFFRFLRLRDEEGGVGLLSCVGLGRELRVRGGEDMMWLVFAIVVGESCGG